MSTALVEGLIELRTSLRRRRSADRRMRARRQRGAIAVTSAEELASNPQAIDEPQSPGAATVADGRIERVPLARLDLRYEELRLGHPSREARVRAQLERGVYVPVVATDRAEAGRLVLVDGFKRVRAAKALGALDVLVQILGFDALSAVAAIIVSNSQPGGLTAIEEARIVAELYRRHGLRQEDVATRLGRDKSWVSRRLQLLEGLHADVLRDVRAGLVAPATAREVARLPRANQALTACAIREHHLTSREAARLVDVLKATPGDVAAVLSDPRAHLPAVKKEPDARPDDPRLGKPGNRLRGALSRLESAANHARTLLREHPMTTLPSRDCAILGKAGSRAFSAARRARKLMADVLPSKTQASDAR